MESKFEDKLGKLEVRPYTIYTSYTQKLLYFGGAI
jgi:hypothetical protein